MSLKTRKFGYLCFSATSRSIKSSFCSSFPNYTMRGGNHLYDELIVEIFTRLPIKSLLRCRSLSKSWYSCIGSPDFKRMHALRSQQKLVIRHRTYERKEGEYGGFYTLHTEDQLPVHGYIGITPLQFPSTYFVIVGSCDGIVCLFDYSNYRISLWNPSIRRTLLLPDCPQRCYYAIEVAFGFDSVTDDYKIVSIPGVNEEGVERSYVYSMKTNAWRVVSSPVPVFCKVKTKACFVSGALHWMVQRNNARCSYYILTFDLSTHVFSCTESPNPAWTLAPIAIEGSLAVIIDTPSLDKWIWVKRRNGSWSVVFKLKQNEGAGCLEGVEQFGTTGALVLDSFGFYVYNPETGTCSKFVDFSEASFLLDTVLYVETLQLLGRGTAC